MVIILLFLMFITGLILSLYFFIPLNQSLPEHAINLSQPDTAIVLENKDSLYINESLTGENNYDGELLTTSKLADAYSGIKYDEIGYDDLSIIQTNNIKTNQYINNTDIFNKNTFYLDFNLLPIENIDNFELFYDGAHIDDITVSIKEYNTDRNSNSNNGINGKKINDYFDSFNKDYNEKDIIGYTLDKDTTNKFKIVDEFIVIPEKNIRLNKKISIENFYDNSFKNDKLYKIRILFVFKDNSFFAEEGDFPIVIKDDSGGVDFITNNNIQLVRTKIHNKKYDIHNLKIYQKNFINKINDIVYN